jgi:WD40 repeat protein
MIVFGDDEYRWPVSDLVFHPDGRHVAVAYGWDSWPSFWDATTGARHGDWNVTQIGRVETIRFHPSGQRLYAVGRARGLVAVDATGFAEPDVYLPSALAVHPSGDRIVVARVRDELISFDTTDLTPEPVWRVGERKQMWYINGVAYFPDGERFATAEYRDTRKGPDAWIHIRSAKDGAIADATACACGIPQQIVVSADGEWFAIRAAAALLVFHMTDHGLSMKLQSPNRKHLTAIAFHPSSRYLAATSNDKTVRLHDRDAGWEVMRTFDWDIGKLKSVAFNAEGTLAAAGGDTGKVVVWDVDV